MRAVLHHSFRSGILFVTAVSGLLLIVAPVLAQMQIPNPLIRPRSLTNPAPKDPTSADTSAQRGAAPGPAAGVASALPTQTPEEIYARSLAELKDRFSTFYVSAIVGKQAILRRSLGGPRGGVLQSTSASGATGPSNAPVPLALAQPAATATAQTGRSDTLMLSDGELLDSVGSSGALIAKINSRQVTIYHVQETMSMPNGKLIGKRAVVFAGDVENSGGTAPPAIVLERVDPAYKRMITVDTRIRSTSGAPDASAGANNNAPAAPAAPAP